MENSIVDAAKIHVGALDDSNWATWKFKIMIALRGLKIQDVVEGKLVPPERLKSDAAAADIKRYEEQEGKYLSADSAALLLITTNLSQENCEKVMRYSTARDVWLELHRLYDGVSESKAYDLCMKFFSYKMQSGGDVSAHVSKLKNIWSELSRELQKEHLKEELPELFLICKILETLPEEYFSFKSSWMMMSKEDRTVENLTTQLSNHERVLSSKHEEKIEALVVRDSKGTANKKRQMSKNSEKSKVEASTDKCFYCGMVGHRIRGCSKWISDGRPPKPKPSTSKSEGPTSSVNMHIMAVSQNDSADRDHWYADNGATSHVTNREDLFQTFERFHNSHTVTTANGDTIKAVGKGIVYIEADVKGRNEQIALNDVWYVPTVQKNLFSVLSAQDKMSNSLFMSTTEECKLLQHGKVLLIGEREKDGGLFKLKVRNIRPECPIEVNNISKEDQLQLYHERLAHQSKAHVKKVIERELGIKLKLDKEPCEGCVYGKAHKLKFGTRERATEPGELIHADVCGPFTNSLSKYKYFVLFKDDFSKFRYIYFLREKSEVQKKLELMLAEAKTAGHTVRELLSDNGGEFDNGNVRRILESYGIEQRLRMPHTPNQNGCVERDNRTVVEAMRTMMHANDLPESLWAELVDTAVYILNRTGPTPLDKSPHEIWYNKKPRIKHLRVIGSVCYAHIPKITRKKLDKKAIKGVLVGYDNDEGYRIWVKEKNRIVRSRDVTFEEKPLKSKDETKESIQEPDAQKGLVGKIEIPEVIVKLVKRDTAEHVEGEPSDDERFEDCGSEHVESEVENEEVLPEVQQEVEQGMRLRDRSTLRAPAKFDFVMMTVAELSDIKEPQSFREAMESKDKEKWKIAMNDEMKSLKENETWEMVSLPKKKKRGRRT